jgi:hypothetical protein
MSHLEEYGMRCNAAPKLCLLSLSKMDIHLRHIFARVTTVPRSDEPSDENNGTRADIRAESGGRRVHACDDGRCDGRWRPKRPRDGWRSAGGGAAQAQEREGPAPGQHTGPSQTAAGEARHAG